jgi:hypothetical protein
MAPYPRVVTSMSVRPRVRRGSADVLIVSPS